MRLKLNKEFAARHIFVAALLVGMAGWFGYDGYVTYPSMTPDALYELIEHSQPPTPETAEKVYANAIPRQKQFMVLCLIGAAVIGLGVFRAARFSFTYRERGFSFQGRRYAIDDVAAVDVSQWKKKGILKLRLRDGAKVTLDNWHHTGVGGFYELLRDAGKVVAK